MSEPRMKLQSSTDISYSRDIPTSVLGTVKNIVKAALKYYIVSSRKNCCAVPPTIIYRWPRARDRQFLLLA